MESGHEVSSYDVETGTKVLRVTVISVVAIHV